ncbi:MAG TPA: hypothetical protein PLL20_19090 [Phycisphaerae bacterium]|nr:hypothetical protein [Phycisphaerae bacterium]HRR86220.1 hypothetical protein [Phycisphaerae bacterium]
MMGRWRTLHRRIRAMKWFSPGSFVLCAATFVVVYLVLHLLGWRESTSIFCGTLPEGRNAQVLQSFQAVMYVLFYMATAVVAPILLIAAAVFQVMAMLWIRRAGEFSMKMQGPVSKDGGSAA